MPSSRSFIQGAIGLAAILMVVLIVFLFTHHGSQEKQIQKILLSALHFKDRALDDYNSALQLYADPNAIKRFQQFDPIIWPLGDPDIGWSFFFNTSLICPGKIQNGMMPVAFYHPWSDVFLVTVWSQEGKRRPRMIDAEVLMGDFLRKKAGSQLEASPLWMRKDIYRPFAVGMAVAQSLRSFEENFSRASAKGLSWRKAIAGFDQPDRVEANYYGTGALLAQNLAEMGELLIPSEEDTAAKLVQGKLLQTLQKTSEGKLGEVVNEATKTIPEAREVLLKIPPQDWRHFRLAAVVGGREKSLVMLTRSNNPDIYMGLLFAREGEQYRLERIDLLRFQSFLEKKLALPLLSLIPSAMAQGGVAGGTPDLAGKDSGGTWTDAYLNTTPEIAQIITREAGGPAFTKIAEYYKEEAKTVDELRRAVASKATWRGGPSEEMKKAGLKLVGEAQQNIETYQKAASWAEKVGKFLKAIDFVSSASQAAGYLYEGDRTGAMGVVANEVAKKTTVLAGSFAGSYVPVVGTILGAEGAERLHEAYTKPVIEKKVDEARYQEYKERLLGSRAPYTTVIGPAGVSQRITENTFVDPNTGKLRERTPEEQEAYVQSYREQLRKKRESTHVLDQAKRDLEDGKITEEHFERIVADFNRGKLKTGEKPKEEAASGGESGEKKDEILNFVSPIKVTAESRFVEDYSYEDVKNSVATTATLTFWNVGALAKGYEEASIQARVVASMGPVSIISCKGSFGGGPQGTFRISCQAGGAPLGDCSDIKNNPFAKMGCDHATRDLNLQGGKVISLTEGRQLTVTNPEAFNNWPKM